jgi:coenzyme PQQ biosynthesis protein PqqD
MTVERPKRRDRVLAEQVDGETVLLNLDSGMYFALNEVGARIWELCDGTRTVAEIVTSICEEYAAPEEVIRADVNELLSALSAEQLVAAL